MLNNVAYETPMRKMGLAEVKACLSDVVSRAEHAGGTVVMRYGKPAALIVPLPRQIDAKRNARGVLAAYARADGYELEEGAPARAMEEKHGNPA